MQRAPRKNTPEGCPSIYVNVVIGCDLRHGAWESTVGYVAASRNQFRSRASNGSKHSMTAHGAQVWSKHDEYMVTGSLIYI